MNAEGRLPNSVTCHATQSSHALWTILLGGALCARRAKGHDGLPGASRSQALDRSAATLRTGTPARSVAALGRPGKGSHDDADVRPTNARTAASGMPAASRRVMLVCRSRWVWVCGTARLAA